MTAATAPSAKPGSLRTRVVAALILAPVALGCVYLGDPAWVMLIALAGTLMMVEWARVSHGGRLTAAGIAAAIVVPAIILAAWWTEVRWGLGLTGVATIAIALLARATGSSPKWLAAGLTYILLPCLSLWWLRLPPTEGLATLLWLLALVWATDTAAYFAGRAIGGPRLAPKISPKKTWAGLGGGMFGAALVGAAAALWLDTASVSVLALVSAGLAIVEQGGDLAESAVKRHFGVKDMGNLIPGHGGILDRVDGLIAVSVVTAVVNLVLGHGILSLQ